MKIGDYDGLKNVGFCLDLMTDGSAATQLYLDSGFLDSWILPILSATLEYWILGFLDSWILGIHVRTQGSRFNVSTPLAHLALTPVSGNC